MLICLHYLLPLPPPHLTRNPHYFPSRDLVQVAHNVIKQTANRSIFTGFGVRNMLSRFGSVRQQIGLYEYTGQLTARVIALLHGHQVCHYYERVHISTILHFEAPAHAVSLLIPSFRILISHKSISCVERVHGAGVEVPATAIMKRYNAAQPVSPPSSG